MNIYIEGGYATVACISSFVWRYVISSGRYLQYAETTLDTRVYLLGRVVVRTDMNAGLKDDTCDYLINFSLVVHVVINPSMMIYKMLSLICSP